MKAFKEVNLKSSVYVDKQKGSVIEIKVKYRVKEIVLNDGVPTGIIKRLEKTLNLVNQ